nr:hypothetical protein Itr_chr15CG13540 [Ipomoea trifida]
MQRTTLPPEMGSEGTLGEGDGEEDRGLQRLLVVAVAAHRKKNTRAVAATLVPSRRKMHRQPPPLQLPNGEEQEGDVATPLMPPVVLVSTPPSIAHVRYPRHCCSDLDGRKNRAAAAQTTVDYRRSHNCREAFAASCCCTSSRGEGGGAGSFLRHPRPTMATVLLPPVVHMPKLLLVSH